MAKTLARVRGSAAKPLWDRVFAHRDFSRNPFRPDLAVAGVFYPVDNNKLSREQFDVLTRAIGAIGERSFLVTATGRVDPWRKRVHWRCTGTTFDDYAKLVDRFRSSETAMYSASGGWGAALSWEEYAIIAGDGHFRSAISELY